ncbi:hypothetical protein Zmor_000008 [Zophobas morio]|uniref:Zasp-like motif domain-containing protein n=1 Tax=Zophobas morio TaxID=2755281 RepID=A0AA38MN50_9CUCU|nr:hypothetical protein Zmor_000008 [Zophobas morio]
MARLVNKQFNSPIGLYSEQNIREVIQRESQILSNGAVGINFNNPTVGKPANLQNSAVLRMLEEEEQRQRSGQSPSLKRVAWPPPNEGENYVEQPPAQAQGGPQYSSQSPTLQNNYTPAPQVSQSHSRQPLKPLDISNGHPQPATSPLANQSPSGFRQAPPGRPWAPVHSPVATPSQPQYPYQAPPQQYQPLQQYQPSQPQTKIFTQQPPQSSVQTVAATNQAAPYSAARPVEPPPATITLRAQAPVSQAPPPVVTSQPATATLKGGKNLRGDLKWPPENVKSQIEEENKQRVELARGPAFRPRLVRKDYGPFFAQHALNSSYPGYKAPPGTQFYDHRAVY